MPTVTAESLTSSSAFELKMLDPLVRFAFKSKDKRLVA